MAENKNKDVNVEETLKKELDEANAKLEDSNKELESAKSALNEANAEKEALLKEIEELKNANVEQAGAYKKGSYIVYTPVENFNGIVAGVQFAYGKANVQPGWILDWFKERGYRVEEVK